MKPDELVFPVMVEDFMAFQCELNGKPLDDTWAPVIEALVPEINAAYECHDREEIEDAVARLNAGASKFAGIEVVCQALEVTKHWLVYAWDRGCRDAEKAVAV